MPPKNTPKDKAASRHHGATNKQAVNSGTAGARTNNGQAGAATVGTSSRINFTSIPTPVVPVVTVAPVTPVVTQTQKEPVHNINLGRNTAHIYLEPIEEGGVRFAEEIIGDRIEDELNYYRRLVRERDQTIKEIIGS